jgi:hypothetical protein
VKLVNLEKSLAEDENAASLALGVPIKVFTQGARCNANRALNRSQLTPHWFW